MYYDVEFTMGKGWVCIGPWVSNGGGRDTKIKFVLDRDGYHPSGKGEYINYDLYMETLGSHDSTKAIDRYRNSLLQDFVDKLD
jgi:hypothetical protein